MYFFLAPWNNLLQNCAHFFHSDSSCSAHGMFACISAWYGLENASSSSSFFSSFFFSYKRVLRLEGNETSERGRKVTDGRTRRSVLTSYLSASLSLATQLVDGLLSSIQQTPSTASHQPVISKFFPWDDALELIKPFNFELIIILLLVEKNILIPFTTIYSLMIF